LFPGSFERKRKAEEIPTAPNQVEKAEKKRGIEKSSDFGERAQELLNSKFKEETR